MGQKVTVTFVDDLDGTAIEDGKGETFKFSVDGDEYEIDLSAENVQKLRDALAPYVNAARRSAKSARGTKARTSPATSKEDLSAAREWLRSEGHKVSDRGRVSSELMELYRNATK